METVTQEGALLADTFGVPLLAYLCAVDEDAISRRLQGESQLRPTQEEVLSQLLTLATRLATDASAKNVPVGLRLDALGRFDERAQTSVGNALRLHAGGRIELAVPEDAVTGPLTCEVKALVGFTGIVLDGVDKIELPFGILRPIREHERQLAPPSVEGASLTPPRMETRSPRPTRATSSWSRRWTTG